MSETTEKSDISSICDTSSISSFDFSLIFDNLTDNDFTDISSYIEDLFNEYIDDNCINMKDFKFIDNCAQAICIDLFNYWYDANICNENSFYTILSLVESLLYNLYNKYQIPNYVTCREDYIFNNDINHIDSTIKYLSKKIQPAQKSPQWYKLRNNIISASSIWKLFKSETTKKNFIKEKVNSSFNKYNNIHSPSIDWGNKYEPVSIMIYQNKYNTVIGEYGCILHDNLNFLGASPDGINIKKDSPLFGRMLEIKNVYNRFINGIPKEEYWIQMQIQMETCNLDLCDFLETRFIEYTENDFYKDTIHYYKGVILHFSKKIDNNRFDINDVNVPYYEYYPVDKCLDYQDINNWINEKKKSMEDTHILYTTLYWYLDELSCVLVKRNTRWFQSVIPIIKESWKDIQLQKKNNLPSINVTLNQNNNYVITNMSFSSAINVVKM